MKNPPSGSSWKTDPDQCENETGQALVQCIENDAMFPLDEIFINNLTQLNSTPFITNEIFGITHSINLDINVITFEPRDSLKIYLNENLEYSVLLSDPNFQFFSPNPVTVPKTLLNLLPKSGYSLVYMKVTLTLMSDFCLCWKENLRFFCWFKLYLQPVKHESLNLEQNPCESSLNYKFNDCVETFIMETVGCKPPWRRFEIDYLPVCSNLSRITDYMDVYGDYASRPHDLII